MRQRPWRLCLGEQAVVMHLQPRQVAHYTHVSLHACYHFCVVAPADVHVGSRAANGYKMTLVNLAHTTMPKAETN
jgi:hypothetical protein